MDEVSTETDTTSVKTTSAQRRSESHRCEVAPIQETARKATEEQKAAELQIVKKPLEVQKTFQQYQAAEEARAIAAKEAVESKGREAAVETSRGREGGC